MWKILVVVAAIPVMLMMALGIDFMMFRAYANALNRPAGPVAYVEMRLGKETQALQAPRMATVTPIGSKKDLARQIDAIYPPAPTGWSKREYVEDDFWTLFPEMAFCKGRNRTPTMVEIMDGDPEGCPMKPQEKGAWIYEKGHQKVAVFIKYFREKHQGGRVSSGPTPSFILDSFERGYTKPHHPHFMRYNGMEFRKLPVKEWYPSRAKSQRTTRIYAEAEGNGELWVYAVARASDDSVKAILRQINRDMSAHLLK